MARILIVEDEASYRRQLSEMLTWDGHWVETAESPEAAVEIGRRLAPELLIVDYLLKGRVNGLAVAKRLQAQSPRVATIIITGYPEERLRAAERETAGLEILEKPFGVDALRGAITRAIESRSTSGDQPIPASDG